MAGDLCGFERGDCTAGIIAAGYAAGCSADSYESYTNHGWRGYPFARTDDTPHRIDWIMVRDGAETSVEVRSCEIVREGASPVWPSDHFPVVIQAVLRSGRME